MPKNTSPEEGAGRVESEAPCWVDLSPGGVSRVALRLAAHPKVSLPVTEDSQVNAFTLTGAPGKADLTSLNLLSN